MDDICDLPPPKYLGKRRQSTVQEIEAFAEKISWKKDEVIEQTKDEVSERY